MNGPCGETREHNDPYFLWGPSVHDGIERAHDVDAGDFERGAESDALDRVCLQRQTQREREREEQGPARSAQGDGRERAQGGRGLSLVFKSRTDVAEKASKGDRER